MQHMTSQQILDRIKEIEQQQTAHTARDLDAEMRDVMLSGGNVDALEEAQLQAERTARRLRVELAALAGALPEAKKQEALAELAITKAAMSDHPEKVKMLADKIAPLVAKLAPLLVEITDTFNRRTLAHKDALAFVRAHGLPDEALEGTGQIICSSFTEASQQLKAALAYQGVDIGNHMEVMRFSTGSEYSTNAVRV